MAISDKIKTMLNRGGNSVLHAFGTKNLGTVLQTIAAAVDTNTEDITAIETAAAKTKHIKHTIVSGDINTGVATVSLGATFDSFSTPVLVRTDAGHVGEFRTITAATISTTEGVSSIAVTCSAVAATDVLQVTVYKTT